VRRHDVLAREIDDDDAAWLRGQSLPDGVELHEVDEVLFMGRTYEMTEGSSLYVPTSDDAVHRVVQRHLKAAEQEREQPIGVDLFSGCGGFSLGLHEAGFDVRAAVEWDAPAAATYLYNLAHPACQLHFATDKDRARWEKESRRLEAHARKQNKDAFQGNWFGKAYRKDRKMRGGCRAFFFGDIRAITGQQIMDAIGGDEVDVVFGGPPCQGLSRANAKSCLEDPRNGLLWEFMRIVDEIRPATFIIENVPQILTAGKGGLFNALAQLANESGYDVVAGKLNAVNYGVPQYRVRAMIVGTREGAPQFHFPMPSTWAIGRPIREKPWSMLEDGDGEKIANRLIPKAKYDPATRAWSVGEASPEKPTRGKKSKRIEQGELLDGAA
jgi:DNA (cytosine-5)-methyltransferase 1